MERLIGKINDIEVLLFDDPDDDSIWISIGNDYEEICIRSEHSKALRSLLTMAEKMIVKETKPDKDKDNDDNH